MKRRGGCGRYLMAAGLALAGLELALFLYFSIDHDQAETGVYRGRYTYGFEANYFSPCYRGENWWVETFQPDRFPELAQAQAAAETNHEADWTITIYIEWRGTRSARRGTPGDKYAPGYGHLGAYPRLFTVDEVIAARPQAPDDCK